MPRRKSPVLKLFTGFDHREEIGWHVFTGSVLRRCSEQVAIIPLTGGQRDGSNAFTYARFLVPHLCGYEGWAIFADASDMVCLGDVAEIGKLRGEAAAYVVKHDYKTMNKIKYIGTDMECPNSDYPRKNWSSLILWNCGHPSNRILTPQMVDEADGRWLHGFSWLADDVIGDLPKEWNVLLDEGQLTADAKLLHWTSGIPAFNAYRRGPLAGIWLDEMAAASEGWQNADLSRLQA